MIGSANLHLGGNRVAVLEQSEEHVLEIRVDRIEGERRLHRLCPALEIADALIRSGTMDIVVVDSVAALVPRAEIEGEMGDSHIGLQARLMSQALRKLSGVIKQTNTAMIFTTTRSNMKYQSMLPFRASLMAS